MYLATSSERPSVPVPGPHSPSPPRFHRSRIPSLTPNPQKGFFISLAIIPAFLALYKYAKSADQDGSEPSKAWFTRLIHSYSQMQESWELRNALHAKMVDQAADDRTLFFNSKGSHGVELRFPEYVSWSFVLLSWCNPSLAVSFVGRWGFKTGYLPFIFISHFPYHPTLSHAPTPPAFSLQNQHD